MNEKIKGHQLERGAYVYVRQSTPYQVRNHLESKERQYALAQHAGVCFPRTRQTMPSAVSSTTSRINCCDAGSELLTRSTCWPTPLTYRTRQVFRHRLAQKVRKNRFEYKQLGGFRDLNAANSPREHIPVFEYRATTAEAQRARSGIYLRHVLQHFAEHPINRVHKLPALEPGHRLSCICQHPRLSPSVHLNICGDLNKVVSRRSGTLSLSERDRKKSLVTQGPFGHSRCCTRSYCLPSKQQRRRP